MMDGERQLSAPSDKTLDPLGDTQAAGQFVAQDPISLPPRPAAVPEASPHTACDVRNSRPQPVVPEEPPHGSLEVPSKAPGVLPEGQPPTGYRQLVEARNPVRNRRIAVQAIEQNAYSGAARPAVEGPVHVEIRRSEEHTSELQSQSNLVCRLLLEKKKSYTVQ